MSTKPTYQELEKRVKELEQVEKMLAESEDRYRSFIHNIQAAVVVHDVDTQIVDCNSKAQELLGLTEDQILARGATDKRWKFLSENGEIMPIENFPVNQVVATQKPIKDMTVCIIRHGKVDPVWVLVNAEPVINHEGNIHQIIVTFTDITEQKRFENALRKSETLLRDAGQMAKVGGWELDANTLEISWTEETYHIYEIPVGQKPPLEEAVTFFHPDDRPKLETAIQKALDHGEPYDMEIRLITAKGKHLWTHTICRPITVDGKTVKLTGTFQDITERKEIERERENLIKELNVALGEVKELRGIIPICSHCKNIRDDKGAWDQLEKYISKRSDVQFSHGICPDCAKILYSDLDL